jgi:hypothetical protein
MDGDISPFIEGKLRGLVRQKELATKTRSNTHFCKQVARSALILP